MQLLHWPTRPKGLFRIESASVTVLEFAANGKPSVADVSPVETGVRRAGQGRPDQSASGPRQEHGEEALMATTLRGSGTETGLARLVDGVKLASGLWLADITDAIGVATFDYRTGAVPGSHSTRWTGTGNCHAAGCCAKAPHSPSRVTCGRSPPSNGPTKGDDIWLTFTARSGCPDGCAT